jgi:DNA-binding CsgD family transcriptional regulator
MSPLLNNIDNIAIFGLHELLKTIIPVSEKRDVYISFHQETTSLCLCELISEHSITIPIIQNDEYIAETINLKSSIPEIKKTIHLLLNRKKSTICRYCRKRIKLTHKEKQIIVLTGLCEDTKSIADYLKTSIKTLYTHQSNIKNKLGIKNRSRFIIWCQNASSNLTFILQENTQHRGEYIEKPIKLLLISANKN